MSDKQKGQQFILAELEKISKKDNILSSSSNIEDEIFKRLMSRKFRKYAANDELKKRIKESIAYRVVRRLPISVTFMQGGFKLWRLEESPEVDWAELFSFMFYSEWLSGVCAIYEPGVVLEVYVMDFIMEVISNYTREETLAYQDSFRAIIKYIANYVPDNLKMQLTTTTDRYGSEEAFWKELDVAVSKFKKVEDITLSPEEITTLELNYRPKKGEILGPKWREENTRVHHAYVQMDSDKAWKERIAEIIAIPYHKGWTYGLHMGATKDSIAKYWIGVGALRERGDSFITTVLSPSQLANTPAIIQDINIEGLNGKNFKRLRLVKSRDNCFV